MNVVITGASNGIGYHTALSLAVTGHRVFALARRGERLEQLQREAAVEGGVVVPVVADLADPARLVSACRVVAAQAQHVDVLVHNAGMLVNRPFAQLDEQDWLSVYRVNVFGVAALTRQLYPLLRGGAHVLHISSMGGVQGSQKFPGL